MSWCKDGADGKTPYIGENGNWWIGTVDTGVRAEGGASTEPDYGNKITGGTCGGSLKWTVTDKNVLIISGKGSMDAYSDGTAPWADYADVIETVVFENGVTTVGKCAFYGFKALKEVELPSSLLSIGSYAFYGCSSLESVAIPSNTRVIGVYAFRKSGLTSLTLRNPEAWSINGVTNTPENMELAGVAAAYIRNEYYTSKWYVAEVAVGDIIASGICGEDMIWTITTDGTLTISGNGVMNNYRSNTMPWYGYIGSIFNVVIDGDITTVGAYAFHGANNLISVTLPNTVTEIGAYAFYGANSLNEISIPASVKSIGKMAFAKCSLKNVYFGNTEGWTAGGAAILASDLFDAEKAAECVALNVKLEWKVDEETVE